MKIVFKCPKCGSTDVQNIMRGSVYYHACYGCGHKWSDVSEDSKTVYRLAVAAVIVFWIVMLTIILKFMCRWISTL